MKLSEIIKLENCPNWLKNPDIQVSKEDMELDSRERVIWKKGIWHNGTFENGTWEKGTWKNGTFEAGHWEKGTWENGTFKFGLWKNGTWKDGTWESGIFKKGTWENGTFENGTWKNGTWKNGTWKDGTWENGTFENGIFKDGLYENGTFINATILKGHFYIPKSCKWDVYIDVLTKNIGIGCTEKSIEDWNNFFYNSTEIISTKRNTIIFERIIKAYELTKNMINNNKFIYNSLYL